MAEIHIGERVINKKGEIGTITGFDDSRVMVDFESRSTKFLSDAFENGFLIYTKADLQKEEYLLKQYYMWKEEQSQKRIPFNRRSCADMITRAARYERLIELGAPVIVVTEEGRCLAEEMVLYYYGKEEPIIWD